MFDNLSVFIHTYTITSTCLFFTRTQSHNSERKRACAQQKSDFGHQSSDKVQWSRECLFIL